MSNPKRHETSRALTAATGTPTIADESVVAPASADPAGVYFCQRSGVRVVRPGVSIEVDARDGVPLYSDAAQAQAQAQRSDD